jgi:hypothetical protein
VRDPGAQAVEPSAQRREVGGVCVDPGPCLFCGLELPLGPARTTGETSTPWL